jgi:hypothetical protein
MYSETPEVTHPCQSTAVVPSPVLRNPQNHIYLHVTDTFNLANYHLVYLGFHVMVPYLFVLAASKHDYCFCASVYTQTPPPICPLYVHAKQISCVSNH